MFNLNQASSVSMVSLWHSAMLKSEPHWFCHMEEELTPWKCTRAAGHHRARALEGQGVLGL